MLNRLEDGKAKVAPEDAQSARLARFAEHIGASEEYVLEKIRESVRAEVLREDFAITRIMRDLIEIKEQSEKDFVLMVLMLAYPTRSYRDVGNYFGVSKQVILARIKRLRQSYDWIDYLACAKRDIAGMAEK